MERTRDFDGVLTGHGIGHQQDFHRLQDFLQAGQFGHQFRIDVKAPGRVDKQGVAIVFPGKRQGFPDNFLRALLCRSGINRQLQLIAESGQLVDGGRTINIRGNQAGFALLLDELARKFGGRGGLA